MGLERRIPVSGTAEKTAWREREEARGKCFSDGTRKPVFLFAFAVVEWHLRAARVAEALFWKPLIPSVYTEHTMKWEFKKHIE